MPRSRLTNIAHTAETNHGIPRRFEEAMSQPDSRFADRSNPSPLIASDAAFGGQSQAINLDRELGIALAGAASDSGSDRIRLARMALGLLDAHLKVSPDDLAAWQARIVALTARGQPKAALADAGAALKIAPDDERTLALAFPFFAGEGDVNEAIRIGRELVAVNPHVARYYGLLAQLLARQGRWREGAEACRAAIRLAPLGLSVRHVLIKCLLELGEHTQARAEAGIYLRFNLEVGERKLIESWLRQAR